jgi:endonuclease III
MAKTTSFRRLSPKMKAKAAEIQRILDELYPETPIPLQHNDPYSLLVAVLLSAQCTDERVNQITPHLFARADNPADMMQIPVEEIKAIIRPCGLSPAKSKAISELSRILIEKHKGQVPQTFEELEALPGVGHKTASVVMSRWGLTNGKNVEQTERDLKFIFPESSWNKLHLQIIFFGRSFCPARSHKPEECPICKWAML